MLFRKPVQVDVSSLHQKLDTLHQQLSQLNQLEAENHRLRIDTYLQQYLFSNPKYKSARRLNRFEFQVFSQYGEDGILAEIFNRIGTTNCSFIEFGVENGTECNTTYLLLKGWKGLWIEGNSNHVDAIGRSFRKSIGEKILTVLHSFVTAENIETLFEQGNALIEPDLLSIDIDRNDYHVWNAIHNYKPRVVVIEYNATFRPGDRFIVPYDAAASWDGSSHFGASLQSYYELGLEKEYKLVACTHAGVNAFFVREDLVKDHFEQPFTPDNHYEPARYFLYKKEGHHRKVEF
ncbi:MAG: hypothetical protein M3352_03465 [Bacteroidota bacterium]|nr:hypothetical protein [Bacteroidota bacterium]